MVGLLVWQSSQGVYLQAYFTEFPYDILVSPLIFCSCLMDMLLLYTQSNPALRQVVGLISKCMRFRALLQVDVVIVVSPLEELPKCFLLYIIRNISLPIITKVTQI